MRTALAMLVVSLGTGCVQVGAEVSEICSTQTIHVDGVPAALVAAPSTTVTHEIDLAPNGADILSRLTLQAGTITAQQGDLAFVEALRISLGTLTLLDYQKGASVPAQIDMARVEENLQPYLAQDGGTKLTVSITGQPPQQGTTLDVDLCFGATVEKTFNFR